MKKNNPVPGKLVGQTQKLFFLRRGKRLRLFCFGSWLLRSFVPETSFPSRELFPSLPWRFLLGFRDHTFCLCVLLRFLLWFRVFVSVPSLVLSLQQPSSGNPWSPKTNPEEVAPTLGPPGRLQQTPTPTRPGFFVEPSEMEGVPWRKGAPVAVF